MRENLFKAKRIDNGEWVEGCLVTRKDSGTDEIFEAHIIEDAYEQLGVMNFGMQPVLISPLSNAYTNGCFRVDKDTICQYTGLFDKNGKKIWENDILIQKTTEAHWFKWECMGVVKYGEHDWNVSEYGYKSIGFYIEPIVRKGDTNKIAHGLNQVDINDEYYPIEVIGNIFDHQDLLKGE